MLKNRSMITNGYMIKRTWNESSEPFHSFLLAVLTYAWRQIS